MIFQILPGRGAALPIPTAATAGQSTGLLCKGVQERLATSTTTALTTALPVPCTWGVGLGGDLIRFDEPGGSLGAGGRHLLMILGRRSLSVGGLVVESVGLRERLVMAVVQAQRLGLLLLGRAAVDELECVWVDW